MAKILLATTCATQPDGSFVQTNTYYDSDLRAAQKSPLVTENVPALSCAAYQIPTGFLLESYCAVANGVGVRRTATTNGGNGILQLYTLTDKVDPTCDIGDLAITYQVATNTSNAVTKDGRLTIEANSSYPPLECYAPPLGRPTSFRIFNAGTLPTLYQFVYENVPPGTYVATIQDANYTQRNTKPLQVSSGSVAIDPNITWFKYRYKDNGQALPQVTGYAWNKTTKQGYVVEGSNINLPMWYQNTQLYPAGTLVFSQYAGSWRIFRAARDVIADSKRHQVTQPTDDSMKDGDWELVPDGSHYFISSARYTISEFDTTINGAVFQYYAAGTIVTYRYNNYYKAKVNLDGRRYQGTTLPFPEVGASNAFWEYLPDYTIFSYLVPESTIVDSYQVGNTVRAVSYYAADPAKPGFVPVATEARPAHDLGDYVLLNDTIPDQESTAGDLVITDIIINNVDDEGRENGSAWIYATTPTPPVQFHLANGVRPGYVQDNTTGIYEDLSAGDYEFYATDAAGRVARGTFPITDRFRLRWRLRNDDLSSEPLETRVFEKDWTGGVTDVIGTDTPVLLSQGTNGTVRGPLPEVIGTDLQFNLYNQEARQFVDTCLKSDRQHRVDHLQAGKLRFRGYIDATSYSEALLGTSSQVTLVATCGLGALADTPFINYLDQRQTGRTNMLSIVLKIISFCSVNLPVYCGLNLRDELMSADGDPLAEAFVHRESYDKKDGKYVPISDYIDSLTVLQYILRLFNAQISQGDGAWHIIALNEVDEPTTQVRLWSPAGTLLARTAPSAQTLRILPPADATGPNELYWINAEQRETIVAAARLGKAIVDRKLDPSLFANGDFTSWVGKRPADWTLHGGLVVGKATAEQVGEYAVVFSNYTTAFSANPYLLSPPAPHLPGSDEDFMRLTLRAKVAPLTTNPDPATLTLFVQLVCDGLPVLNPLPVAMSSADDWKDYVLELPLGLPGKQVRVRLVQPVLAAGSPASRLLVSNAHLSIQPGQVDWSSQPTEYQKAENPDVTTGIILDDIVVANADVPVLYNVNDQPLPPKAMDVFAWKHAISLADYAATGNWMRPGEPAYHSLLYTIAQDRTSLRAAPSVVLTGTVSGPGMSLLRQGLMLDIPAEQDGKFLVLACAIDKRKRQAKITCLRLADGAYDGAYPEVPDNVRIATALGKLGYRISEVDGDVGFRIAHV